jgi:hypothetical protein
MRAKIGAESLLIKINDATSRTKITKVADPSRTTKILTSKIRQLRLISRIRTPNKRRSDDQLINVHEIPISEDVDQGQIRLKQLQMK